MRHKSKNKTRPLFTLSLEMTRLVNKTRLLLVPGVNSDIHGTWMLENMAGSAKMSVNIFTKPSTMVRIADKYTKLWGQRYRGSTGLTATTGIGMNRAGAGVVGWAADSSPVC